MRNKADRRSPTGLADFAGDWVLAREMVDHRAGVTGRLDGTAAFTPEPGGMIYDERGTLRYGDQAPVEAGRRYLWWQAPGDGIDVLFADGRFFHALPLEGGSAAHFCAPDQYDVTYDFSDWPNWQAEWQVRGPRKDYVMTSRYTRPAARE